MTDSLWKNMKKEMRNKIFFPSRFNYEKKIGFYFKLLIKNRFKKFIC